jgi:hypothetical protein
MAGTCVLSFDLNPMHIHVSILQALQIPCDKTTKESTVPTSNYCLLKTDPILNHMLLAPVLVVGSFNLLLSYKISYCTVHVVNFSAFAFKITSSTPCMNDFCNVRHTSAI